MITVPGNVRLARHVGDLDDDGHDTTGNTPDEEDVRDAGRWELAVIAGAPPDPLYADGDFLYIWVSG